MFGAPQENEDVVVFAPGGVGPDGDALEVSVHSTISLLREASTVLGAKSVEDAHMDG